MQEHIQWLHRAAVAIQQTFDPGGQKVVHSQELLGSYCGCVLSLYAAFMIMRQ